MDSCWRTRLPPPPPENFQVAIFGQNKANIRGRAPGFLVNKLYYIMLYYITLYHDFIINIIICIISYYILSYQIKHMNDKISLQFIHYQMKYFSTTHLTSPLQAMTL